VSRAGPSLELDHVLIAVHDLAAAAAELEAGHGLASIEGGHHRGWGTQNRIVPLGETYLELIAVVDAEEAAGSDFGQWVTRAADGAPLGWAVRTDDLDAVAGARGLAVWEGSRPAPGGEVLRWRGAGSEQAAAAPCLPFFIEWGSGATFPGRSGDRPAGASGITRVELRGDPARLDAWLGDHALPIEIRPGSPAVTAVVVQSPRGAVRIPG